MNSLTHFIDHDNGVQTSYRQTNFGSTECRISYSVDYDFCGKMSGREERGQGQQRWYCTGPISEVTNLFLSMCGQDAIIKFRSLMSPRNVIDTPYKDIRLAIQNYLSPKERVVSAERAKFLSKIQGVGESDDNFLARLREEARYCDFEKLRTAANPEKELIKINFISGLRDPEKKLRLLDGIKAKPAMSNTEMTKSLQFRSEAMAFASSSSGNKPFNVKEEVGFNFKKTFRKPNEKITAI